MNRKPEHIRVGCIIALARTIPAAHISRMNALVALGEIRNSFAHKVNAHLTPQLVSGLYNKLPAHDQTRFRCE